MVEFNHIVSVSGGKDSTATLLLALMRGMPFQAVFADTGHENPVTTDYVDYLSDRLGVEILKVRACFKARIEKKRTVVQTKWVKEKVPDAIIEAALAALHPTGNPFLDLAIWKGRFPSTRAQFCTCLLYTSPSPRDGLLSRMPSSA